MGEKIKTHKNPWTKTSPPLPKKKKKTRAQFPRYKNFQRNYAYAEVWKAGTIMNPQIVLNTQKSHYLNQATQKILAKIFV